MWSSTSVVRLIRPAASDMLGCLRIGRRGELLLRNGCNGSK